MVRFNNFCKVFVTQLPLFFTKESNTNIVLLFMQHGAALILTIIAKKKYPQKAAGRKLSV